MLESMQGKGWGGRACQMFITTYFRGQKKEELMLGTSLKAQGLCRDDEARDQEALLESISGRLPKDSDSK